MASGPITSWQINGEKMETVRDFIFLGSKITEDSDCSHEIKRLLLLGIKVMTNLDSILRSRDNTLPSEVCIVQLSHPYTNTGKKQSFDYTDLCWQSNVSAFDYAI